MTLLRNPAHLMFAYGKGLDSLQPPRIFTDFAASAESWAELLLNFPAKFWQVLSLRLR